VKDWRIATIFHPAFRSPILQTYSPIDHYHDPIMMID